MKNAFLSLKESSISRARSVFEVIDTMIICHSVLSVDIFLELNSRNSEMIVAVCICLLLIVRGQYLLFLFSLMNSKIKKN